MADCNYKGGRPIIGWLIVLVRVCVSPIAWVLVPLLRLAVRVEPIFYCELLRHVPPKSRSYSWLGNWAKRAPATSGEQMRAAWFRSCLNYLGENPMFSPDVEVVNPDLVKIGHSVSINYYTMIVAFDRIVIGSDVLIGPHVLIHSGRHIFSDVESKIRTQGHVGKPIVIEDDVWVGAHAVILSGVSIGRGAVVGAGAIVNRDVPPYAIVAGVPARQIGNRSTAS